MSFDGIDWRKTYASLCDAPVEALSKTDFDNDHPAIEFAQAWDAMPRVEGHDLPCRSNITPREFSKVMKWMFLFSQEDYARGARYKVALAGTAVVELTHGDYTGQYLDQFTSDACYHSRFDFMEDALRTKQPYFGQAKVSRCHESEYRIPVTLGAFPLVRQDGTPQVLVIPCPANKDLRRLL